MRRHRDEPRPWHPPIGGSPVAVDRVWQPPSFVSRGLSARKRAAQAYTQSGTFQARAYGGVPWDGDGIRWGMDGILEGMDGILGGMSVLEGAGGV